MEQNPFLQTNRFAASQEIPRILWNSKVPYHIHNCPHLSLSSASSIQSISPHSTSCLSFHLRLVSQVVSFLCFPHQNHENISPLPVQATRTAHLILLDFITPTILGEEYRSLTYSLYSSLHFLVTSSLLGQNSLLNTLF